MASLDEDEDAAFDDTFNDVDSDNSKATPSPYTSISRITFAPHTDITPPSKQGTKWSQRHSACHSKASARSAVINFLSTKMNSIPSTLQSDMSSSVATIVPQAEDCCGDTGATDDMFPDCA